MPSGSTARTGMFRTARWKSARAIAVCTGRSGAGPSVVQGPLRRGSRMPVVDCRGHCTLSWATWRGRATIGTRRNQSRSPSNRIRAITRWLASGRRSAWVRTDRRGILARPADPRREHRSAFPVQRDRHVDLLARFGTPDVVAAVDGEERRHVERLVDVCRGRRRRGAGGSSGARRGCCAPRRRRPGARRSAAVAPVDGERVEHVPERACVGERERRARRRGRCPRWRGTRRRCRAACVRGSPRWSRASKLASHRSPRGSRGHGVEVDQPHRVPVAERVPHALGAAVRDPHAVRSPASGPQR